MVTDSGHHLPRMKLTTEHNGCLGILFWAKTKSPAGQRKHFIFSIVIKFAPVITIFCKYLCWKKIREKPNYFFLSQTHLLNWQLGVLGQRHGAAIILLEEPLGIYTKSGMHGGGDTISDILEKISLKRGYNIIM